MPIITENNYTFTSADGETPIHVREWVPDCDINGVVQIAHGINEYIGRYADFARFLASKGFVVVGNDHLGHGESVLGPEYLGFFALDEGWYKVVADMEHLRQLSSAKWPEAPYFIFGHSMGSFLTRTYMFRYPGAQLAGVILSGTGQAPEALVAAGRFLCDGDMLKNGPFHRSEAIYNIAFGSYNKQFEPRRTNYDWLTRDKAVVDAYMKDPLCTFIPTTSLFRDMMFGISLIGRRSNLEKMNKALPVLFISGDKDPVGGSGVQVAKVYSMFIRAGMRDVFYKFYKDGRHEVLNELNRAEVYKDVLDWLFRKLG